MTGPRGGREAEATPRFPTFRVVFATVLTVAVCAWLGWQAYDNMRFADRIDLESGRFETLRGEILRLDEVLTMSAQMGAATGAVRWQQRYDQAAPELDSAIESVTELAPLRTIAESAARLKAANSALVAMEAQAFTLAAQGLLSEAQAVLFAQAYVDQKQIYADSVTQLTNEVQDWRNKTIVAKSHQSDYLLVAALALLALALAVALIVLRRVQGWRVELLAAIDERKAAEEALQQANDGLETRVRERTSEVEAVSEKLRSMSVAAQDAIIMIDDQGAVSFWNPAAAEMFGWSEEEMLGRDLHETIAPAEYHVAQREAFARFKETGEGTALGRLVELKGIRKDGSEFPVELSIAPIREGDSWHAVGTIRDITERNKAEETIKDSEQRYRAIFDNANDMITIHDLEGRILEINGVATERLGYGREELLHKTVVDLRTSDSAAHFSDNLEEVRHQGGAVFEATHLRQDGTVVPVEVSSRLIQYAGSQAVISIARDITERKQAEEHVRRAKEQTETTNRELEVAVVRANQLAVEAQTATAAKGEFVANMSHEIRTPMNGVLGMTSLLLDTKLDAEQHGYAEAVRTSGEALLTIINDILDFSKVEAGKLEMENLRFNLRATLEDVGDLLSLRAHEKGLEFTTLVEPDVPSLLWGDPGRLRQVLTNLVGNAIKFTDRGEVAVAVSLDSEDEETAMLRFSVRDTGIGITDEKQGILFQPFTQADASTTRRFGGTGLGLSISKSLVELMHGAIGVTSAPGQGSTFWFTARFDEQTAATADADTEAGGLIGDAPSASIEGTRVLAVDDNPTNRKVIAGMLKPWGVRHVEVESARQALDALQSAAREGDPFRLAILDMQMPDVDGEMLGAMIREDHVLDDTALVMMTSMGGRGDAARLEKAGFAAYLMKPVKQSQLYDCLVTVLGRSKSGVAPEAARIITRHSLTDLAKSRVRILLAEDNAINQEVALATLGKMGYRAAAVANGREAVAALEMQSYDLVLMDVQMPEMDGFEATATVRDPLSRVRNHSVPIIALTAHAMAGDREKCLAAGMNDYLSKPLRPEELSRTIERWTAGDRKRPTVTTEPSPQPPDPASRESGEQATKASDPIFDREVLLHTLAGDEELAREIITAFLADARLQLQALREAASSGSADRLRRQAHALKGASGTVGALALSAEAGRLEADGAEAGSGRLEGAQERVAALEAALGRFADSWGVE